VTSCSRHFLTELKKLKGRGEIAGLGLFKDSSASPAA
jgi:hypothetical protein